MRIKTLLFLFGAFLLSHTARSQCTDIFISEYIEGSSNNKGIEIYNPSTDPVDLSNYKILMSGNGGSFTNEFSPTGILTPGDVYVIVTDEADSVMKSVADVELGFPSIVHYNGDDALAIINIGTGDTVDVFGVIGMDPGSSWPVDTGFTRDFTLVRNASVDMGSTDWAVGATQYDVFPNNTYTELGSHTKTNPATLPACMGEACVDLYFSEYIEGSGNNKGIEIYNPSGDTANLANYKVHESGNGGSFFNDYDLSGSLAPGDVYVIVTDEADSVMKSVADVELGFPSIVHFNGDDALFLINVSTGDTLDGIGILGEDPGSNWPVDTGSTANHTLVRMPSVTAGTTDWAVGATQWLVSPQNTFDSLGAHTSAAAPMGTVCAGPPPAAPEVSFGETEIDVTEGDTVEVIVNLASINPDDSTNVTVTLGTSTATNGADFVWMDTTLTLTTANASDTLSIAITDDMDIESEETLVLGLSNATNGAVLGADSTLTITIADNDYRDLSIALLIADSDSNGVGDSVGVKARIQGVVHGIDFDGNNGYSFTLIDSTGGINIFNFNDVPSGYQSTEGDNIIAVGTVAAFRGLTELIVDEIELVSSGNALFEPTEVSALNESTESEHIILGCVTIVDTADWPTDSTAGSRNIDFTNGVDTFTVRIDSDAAIRGSAYPTGNWFNIRGVGGQFDSNTPALGGYQIFPDSLNDFVVRNPVIGFYTDAKTVPDTATTVADIVVVATNNNPDTTTVTVSLGAGTTATLGTDFNWTDTTFTVSGCENDSVALPLEVIGDTDEEGPEWVELVITSVDNNATVSIDTITVRLVESTVSITNLLPANAIQLYPNPAQDQVILDASLEMERISLVNLVGQTIMQVEENSVEQRLDISQLPAGIYMVRVETAEGLWISKLQKK